MGQSWPTPLGPPPNAGAQAPRPKDNPASPTICECVGGNVADAPVPENELSDEEFDKQLEK